MKITAQPPYVAAALEDLVKKGVTLIAEIFARNLLKRIDQQDARLRRVHTSDVVSQRQS